MQLGGIGIGNGIGGLNGGAWGVGGNSGASSATTFAGPSDSSGDIYASVYQAGSDDYMMEDGLDVYA